MVRIILSLYQQPAKVEVYVRLKGKSGIFEPEVGIIDTGAEQSLFPLKFLETYEHHIINENLVIDQAGIAKQGFRAVEAVVRVYFEDRYGNKTDEMNVRAWFADTEEIIIGFQDVLDRATLHVDYRQSRTGWIEF
jgi:hypothetical protein